MGEFIGVLVAIWIAWMIFHGYRTRTAKPIPMRDDGHGVMEPVCPDCSAKLVAITRDGGASLTGVLGWLVLLAGLGVLLLANWLVGGMMVGVGMLLHIAGKSRITVLACPSCGKTVKRLD